jgi:hypothetical protein
VFKDKEPRKAKIATDWEKEEQLRKSMVRQYNKLKKHKPKQKGHPHPWRDGTQLGWVCQILLLWKHINLRR